MFREIITKFENRKQRKRVNLFQDKTMKMRIQELNATNQKLRFVVWTQKSIND